MSDDLCNFVNIQEILRVTFFDLKCEILPELNSLQSFGQKVTGNQEYIIRVGIDNVQLDNQMYDVGLYRFPVVLVKHEKSDKKFLDLNLKLSRFENKTFVDKIKVSLGKTCVYLEDTLAYILQDYSKQYLNIGSPADAITDLPNSVPLSVVLHAESCRNPFYLERLEIKDMSLQVTVYASIKVHLGLEDTVLNLTRYEASNLWCTGFSLGHIMSRHYLSGALFKAGWVIGSLDVIGIFFFIIFKIHN